MSGLDAYTTALPFSNLEEQRLPPSPPEEDTLQSQEIKNKVRYTHVTDKSTIITCVHSQFAFKRKILSYSMHPWFAFTKEKKNHHHSMHHKNISKHALTFCIQKKFVSHNMHPWSTFSRKFSSHKHASTYQHAFTKIAPHHASTCIP